LVENTIRPIALGRKNYVLVGSDQAFQNLAILYSLVNTCRKNDINVRKDSLFAAFKTERVVVPL